MFSTPDPSQCSVNVQLHGALTRLGCCRVQRQHAQIQIMKAQGGRRAATARTATFGEMRAGLCWLDRPSHGNAEELWARLQGLGDAAVQEFLVRTVEARKEDEVAYEDLKRLPWSSLVEYTTMGWPASSIKPVYCKTCRCS